MNKRPASAVNASSVLRILNPQNKPYIDLTSKNQVLLKVPFKSREIIDSIMQSYSEQHRSSKMPVNYFLRKFEGLNPDFWNEERSQLREQLVSLSRERSLNSYDSESKKPKKPKPTEKPKDKGGSYLKVYEQRKKQSRPSSVKRRRNSEMSYLNFDYREKPSKPSQYPKSFRDVYPNVKQLIQIRKAHLSHCKVPDCFDYKS